MRIYRIVFRIFARTFAYDPCRLVVGSYVLPFRWVVKSYKIVNFNLP